MYLLLETPSAFSLMDTHTLLFVNLTFIDNILYNTIHIFIAVVTHKININNNNKTTCFPLNVDLDSFFGV